MRTSSLFHRAVPSELDKVSPLCSGGSREELAATTLTLGLLHSHESQIRLLHQRCRLERLARLLLDHLGRRQFPEFLVDQRQ